jgi:hypothetical protein
MQLHERIMSEMGFSFWRPGITAEHFLTLDRLARATTGERNDDDDGGDDDE